MYIISIIMAWPTTVSDDVNGVDRVLVYNPHAAPGKRVQELVVRLNFPNGLELSKDESYLLIAEGARARIYR